MSNEIEFGMDVGTPGGDRSAIMVMEVGQVDRFTIHVSPLPTHLMVPDYFEPDSEILELLESCRREMEKACSLPANILTARDEETIEWTWPRRDGKTSYIEALRNAVLREAVNAVALRPAPPMVLDYDLERVELKQPESVRGEIVRRYREDHARPDPFGYYGHLVATVMSETPPNLNAHWMAVIEEPEPGEREMSAVRAMCRGL